MHTFFVQLEGCPGFVEICCSRIEVPDKNRFLDMVDAGSPMEESSLVRVSISVGCYCLKKRAFVDCVIHKVLEPGEVLEDPWLVEEKIPVQDKALCTGLVAPVRRTGKRWSCGGTAIWA